MCWKVKYWKDKQTSYSKQKKKKMEKPHLKPPQNNHNLPAHADDKFITAGITLT